MKRRYKRRFNPFNLLFKLLIIIVLKEFLEKTSQNQTKKAQFKKRLKYFNPIIKKGAFGSEHIEWQGRPQPLTDTELNNLL